MLNWRLQTSLIESSTSISCRCNPLLVIWINFSDEKCKSKGVSAILCISSHSNVWGESRIPWSLLSISIWNASWLADYAGKDFIQSDGTTGKSDNEEQLDWRRKRENSKYWVNVAKVIIYWIEIQKCLIKFIFSVVYPGTEKDSFYLTQSGMVVEVLSICQGNVLQ